MLQNVLKCYRDATGFALCKFLFRYQPFPGPEMETYPFLVRSVLKSNTQSICDCALYLSTDLARDGYVSIQRLPFTPGPPTNARFGKIVPILPNALPILLNFYHLKMCYTRLSLWWLSGIIPKYNTFGITTWSKHFLQKNKVVDWSGIELFMKWNETKWLTSNFLWN